MRHALSFIASRAAELLRRNPREAQVSWRPTYFAWAAGVAVLAAVCFERVPVLKRIELGLLDVRFRLRPGLHTSGRLATLDIDRAAIERAGAWPVPRAFYADLARVLSDYDATLMCMDLFLPDASPRTVPSRDVEALMGRARAGTATAEDLARVLARLAAGGDADLAGAMRETGSTVLAFTFTEAVRTGASDGSAEAVTPQQRRALEAARPFSLPGDTPALAGRDIPCAAEVELPLPDFVAHAAGLGFAQVVLDEDGIARRYPLFVRHEGRIYPSLALAAVSLVTRRPVEAVASEGIPGPPRPPGSARRRSRDPGQGVPADQRMRMTVNWAGDYLDTFLHVPATVALRFRGVDLVRRRLQELAGRPGGVTAEGIRSLTEEITDRKLLEPSEASAVTRVLLLAQIAEASAGEPGGRDSFVRDFGRSEGGGAGETAAGIWDQVVCNARILERLRRNPEEPYPRLKAHLNIPDDRDAVQRHAAEMLRFLLAHGRNPETWRPHYFFPPVRVESGRRVLRLSPLDLTGKVFFVGLTATGTHDFNPMPFSPRYPMVGLHVNAANTILTQQFLRSPPPYAHLLIGLAFAFLMAAVTPSLHPVIGAVFCLLIEGLYLVAAQQAFVHAGLCLPLSAPSAALGATYVSIVVHRFFLEQKEKRGVRDAYLAYKAQVERELSIAREIQSSVLPSVFPPFPDRTELDLFAAMDPAREVGGDLYDFFWVDPDTLFFLVGDVSGKGIPAALFMMTVRTLMRGEALRGGSPEDVLARVNDRIAAENEANMFVTVLCGTLNARTGGIRLANAGHNPPLLRRGPMAFRYFALPPSPVLGIIEGSSFGSTALELGPGDALFLYTDGVTEAMNPREELFSEERLERALAGAQGVSMRDVVNAVRESVRVFIAGAPPSDDVTMLGLRFDGAGRPSEQPCVPSCS